MDSPRVTTLETNVEERLRLLEARLIGPLPSRSEQGHSKGDFPGGESSGPSAFLNPSEQSSPHSLLTAPGRSRSQMDNDEASIGADGGREVCEVGPTPPKTLAPSSHPRKKRKHSSDHGSPLITPTKSGNQSGNQSASNAKNRSATISQFFPRMDPTREHFPDHLSTPPPPPPSHAHANVAQNIQFATPPSSVKPDKTPLSRVQFGGESGPIAGGSNNNHSRPDVNNNNNNNNSITNMQCSQEHEVVLAEKAPWIKKAQAAMKERDEALHELALTHVTIETLMKEKKILEKNAQHAYDRAQNLEERCQRVEEEVEAQQARAEERAQTQRAAVTELAISKARLERRMRREETALASSRLGSIGVQRVGASLQEIWEDGIAFSRLAEQSRGLQEQREALDVARKALKRRVQPAATTTPSGQTGASTSGGGNERSRSGSEATAGGVSQEEFLMRDEMYRARVQALRSEELSLMKERERLDTEKGRHITELRRLRDEEASRFNAVPEIGGRYVLLHLLGRGGFSEVYKAFDVVELREVACKIHQLNTAWNEAKKQNYVKHTVREYNIHKALEHRNVVSLYDVFEIDTNTFCTVLDFCGGGDLDAHLKENKILCEREARSIIVQIFSGLDYLADPKRRVIHYDLKPGNIIFDRSGLAKITDFGLSKVMENGDASMMELTSQGAGTYWYLPPECFEIGSRPPQISNKVDVWAAGVILFQMLYGRRPFGHNLSQEKILREEVIVNARMVEFPAKPTVSEEAKDFIRRCLSYRQEHRPDIAHAAADPYLSYTKTTLKGGR
mmetsp:Transcript_13800/g.23321  ORF Transcript_13800/g.23321 Transcript_13800/m.23321 type:complete len:792 (+) Transcript_13800:402-2777(+)